MAANSRFASALSSADSLRKARSVLKNMKLTNWRCVEVASARAACAWGSTVVVIVGAIVSLSDGALMRRGDDDRHRTALTRGPMPCTKTRQTEPYGASDARR